MAIEVGCFSVTKKHSFLEISLRAAGGKDRCRQAHLLRSEYELIVESNQGEYGELSPSIERYAARGGQLRRGDGEPGIMLLSQYHLCQTGLVGRRLRVAPQPPLSVWLRCVFREF